MTPVWWRQSWRDFLHFLRTLHSGLIVSWAMTRICMVRSWKISLRKWALEYSTIEMSCLRPASLSSELLEELPSEFYLDREFVEAAIDCIDCCDHALYYIPFDAQLLYPDLVAMAISNAAMDGWHEQVCGRRESCLVEQSCCCGSLVPGRMVMCMVRSPTVARRIETTVCWLSNTVRASWSWKILSANVSREIKALSSMQSQEMEQHTPWLKEAWKRTTCVHLLVLGARRPLNS